MDNDAKIDELLTLTKENNKMLSRMRATQVRHHTFQMIYWLIVIGIAVGAFYFLQPYFDDAKKLLSDGLTTFQSFTQMTSIPHK